jgi:hypothetical protein
VRARVGAWQGDQIYAVGFSGSGSGGTGEAADGHGSGWGRGGGGGFLGSSLVVQSFGGHLNHQTFLKAVAYWGPRDACAVSGSDDGHLWWCVRREPSATQL